MPRLVIKKQLIKVFGSVHGNPTPAGCEQHRPNLAKNAQQTVAKNLNPNRVHSMDGVASEPPRQGPS
jgi:hypothetical protein